MSSSLDTGGSSTATPEHLELAAALSGALRGEVAFDGGTRGIYATDSSNYRHVPLGVVFPLDEEDVAETLRCCREAGVAVVLRGGGTSLAGQACNEAVVLDTSRHFNSILSLDPEARTARVQPGVVLDRLREAAEVHGLTFGPDPATHAWCTLGGMIGNNSCGTHGVYAGRTSDNVERLRVLTYRGARLELGPLGEPELAAARAAGGENGRIHGALADLIGRYGDAVRQGFPTLGRRVSGYNLDDLLPERGFHVARSLVGSESTCAVVVEAELRLVKSPRVRRLVVLGFADVLEAADAVPDVLAHGLLALEGFDDELVRQMRAGGLHVRDLPLLPPGGGWLLAEVGADEAGEADALAEKVAHAHRSSAEVAVFSSAAEQAAVWRIRESGLGATARPPGRPPNFEGWEDAAVPPERLGQYLRGIRALWAEHGYSGAWYGHFGQGCVHTRNNFDFSSAEGLVSYRSFVEQAADLCVSLGGSISGEHGDGQARGELLERMYGPELVGAFREFKAIWDPDQKMNPGRVVDARPLDADLHFGPTYRRVSLSPTRFAFSKDGGSMQRAAERCVGVGRCRRDGADVMCPSFRATRDERHATRGRAKLLVEMFQGETTPATWRNEEVFDALELCLSCKGCAVDCPTHVDMATYKAEFLSHYYAGRFRPLAAYLLALLPWLARPASRVPRLANAVLGDHRLGRALKRAGGISPERPAPAFARRSFRRTPTARAHAGLDGTVVLWSDTFSDLYVPQRAQAAVKLLEHLGERVAVPAEWACCGRPLYDTGMLGLARRTLARVLDVLGPALAAGTPIVVLEPSCLATFRDELVELFPDDPRARLLAGLSRSLAEHLRQRGDLAEVLRGASADSGTPRAVAVHPHCHQRAIGGTDAEREVLEAAGFEVTELNAGCCGLAGSFGFRAEHDALSREIAATGFLPALAALGPEVARVMDGFSCSTQATHLGEDPGTSLAELLAKVLGADGSAVAKSPPAQAS
ncbi:MAG: linked oxidase domain protein [Acidimicrobiaceae bacterium]|nr:linked oxidase domain protein [Acidimicrobiaceae bacterium]